MKNESFSKYDYIESRFNNISYLESPLELSKIKTNALFFEYKDALRVAKIIFKLKSFKENTRSQTNFVTISPFIIDMPKLFELYVLSKLKEAKLNIGYQQGGNYGVVDFLEYDRKIIIDTKYKTIYENDKNNYKIEDIRQVSGYARDVRLLKKLFNTSDNTWKTTVPKCLIIYPDKTGTIKMPCNPDDLLKSNINQFNEFYRYGIRLPENTTKKSVLP
jgi:5-methylcytosine-specific restriction enzyme subunit McrC